MDDQLTLQQFYLKFNFQKMLRMDIPEDDHARISQALGIELSAVVKFLGQFDRSVKTIASQIRGKTSLDRLPERPLKVAFAGDSITSDRESYFQIIKEVLSASRNIEWIDDARSGNTTVDLIGELYTNLINKSPDLACIMIGTNDIKRNKDIYGKNFVGPGEFQNNLEYIITRLKDAGCRIILSTIPPNISGKVEASYPESHWVYSDDDYKLYNEIIRKVATKFQIILNDMVSVFEITGHDEVLMDDGMHLSHKGQELMARQLLPKIIATISGHFIHDIQSAGFV